ncbi:MAG: mechanosensitive ion channel protein MscS [Legionellaceae bacterium]|nr:mechanosensitive ion channel protein MscS [Legionellaceae bacterium]HCA88998.1 mechanosensitive ion channel protein MscS [Legionellales bacterium]
MQVFCTDTTETTTKLITFLTEEQDVLNSSLNNIKILPPPHDQTQYQQFSQEISANLALNKAKIASLESFLINQKKIQTDYQAKIKQLQQFSTKPSFQINTQQKIEQVTALNNTTTKAIDLIQHNLKLANQYQSLLLEQKRALNLWKSKASLKEHAKNLLLQEQKLNQALETLYENSIVLQKKIKEQAGFNTTYYFETRLLLNNQVINLTQHKIAELNLQQKLANADYLLLKSPNIRTLQKVTDTYKDAINQLSNIEQALKKIALMLQKEKTHIKDKKLNFQFLSLLKVIHSRIAGIIIQEQTLQEDLENHQIELKKQLSVRQSLFEYRVKSGSAIVYQFEQIPAQFYQYLKSLAIKVKDNYLWQDFLPCVLIWSILIAASSGFLSLSRLLQRLTRDKERSRLSGHLYDGLLVVITRNIPLVASITLLFILFYLNKIPYTNYKLLFNLLGVWIIFRTLILIARLSLMERVTDVSGKDVRLYYRIKWLLIMGGMISAFTILSYQLPLSLLLQDIFNRLFMLFLVSVSLVIWKSREAIHYILYPFLKVQKRYIKNAILLLVILTPLTLFIIAIIGLIGYLNLAWTMSSYQMQIVAIIISFIILRGLITDALELISEWMISSLKSGWLWIEVFLKPIDNALKVIIVLTACYALFWLFDWRAGTSILSSLQQIGNYPLLNLSGIYITSLSIVEFLVLASIFLWVSKWTRECCYRWVFRDARDAGIRNSLSVFTQYAVILIGGFLTLRVLGLDFSGMSMIVGGLAVGLGFGLRDFASNVVGGLMLLIERPVREGDLITLGGYEGQVSHIGIRSMRVCSWDNTEVLIPNAETFNKPFTNWTHQNNIVRTVIPIRVSRADDPVIIQQLILKVLSLMPEIVDSPPSQVFLAKIDEALLSFEIRYFINVQLNNLFDIRSRVLFAIMAQFKAAGVKAPIPPFNVKLTEEERESLAQIITQDKS